MLSVTGFITLFFLLSSNALAALTAALQHIGKLQAEELLKSEHSPVFFRRCLDFFFGKHRWEGLLFSLSFTKHFLRICFVLTTCFFLIEQEPFRSTLIAIKQEGIVFDNPLLFILVLAIVTISLLFDFFFHLFGQLNSQFAYRLLSPFASFILLLCTPLTSPFFRLMKAYLPQEGRATPPFPSFRIRDKVYELIQETELGAYLDTNEQKLILSVVSFKERIAREVMVPRINLTSLSVDTPLKETVNIFLKEGYSRIPVYKDSVDNIVGVLLYKDVLKCHIEQELPESAPIEKIVKPVLYTPETKKISQLLQEFRSKQIHLAIIVDEWGGTEGIVTIEDILEELVGEIADEYDIAQQSLFTPLASGGWLVDAKMSIVDIQEELGVKIPLSPEYDTIGGYVFHKAGAIPTKGWKIHHDDFDLEVMSSTERSIDKIKIISH